MAKYTNHFIEPLNKNIYGNYNAGFMQSIRVLPFVLYSIPYEYSYRPDLISYKFYGRSDLAWVITFYNSFQNSPEDYYYNRRILIPDVTTIEGSL